MLLLPEWQAGEALEPSEKQNFLKNLAACDTRVRLGYIAFKVENKKETSFMQFKRSQSFVCCLRRVTDRLM
jgi:hypothetical protein